MQKPTNLEFRQGLASIPQAGFSYKDSFHNKMAVLVFGKSDDEPENVVVEISEMSVTGKRVAILGGESHDPSKLAIFLRF